MHATPKDAGLATSAPLGIITTFLHGHNGTYSVPLSVGPLTITPKPGSTFEMGDFGLLLNGTATIEFSESHHWVELIGTSINSMLATFFDDAGGKLGTVKVGGHLPLAYANDNGIRSFEASHDSSVGTPSLWKVSFRELPSDTIPLTGYNGEYSQPINLGDATITGNPGPVVMQWTGLEHVNRPRIDLGRTYTHVALTGTDHMTWLRAVFFDGNGKFLAEVLATDYDGPLYQAPNGIRYVELLPPGHDFAATATSIIATDDAKALIRYMESLQAKKKPGV
jgi:hypothetical protein